MAISYSIGPLAVGCTEFAPHSQSSSEGCFGRLFVCFSGTGLQVWFLGSYERPCTLRLNASNLAAPYG